MTDQELLDSFAKEAMAAIISKMQLFGGSGKWGAKGVSAADGDEIVEKVAGGAYLYARAMMKARKNGDNPPPLPVV